MSDGRIAVLVIEDNPADARLVGEMLADAKGAAFDVLYADSLSTGLERLAEGGIDVILLDLNLPDSHGLDTFVQVRIQAQHLPIVVLTGLDDDKMGAEALRAGAQDYLVKGAVGSDLLARSIRYAIERKRVEEALRASERALRIRNRISDVFFTLPDEEMYGAVLWILLEVMQSIHGVFGYIDENGDLVCPSLTRDAWEPPRIPQMNVVFPREEWRGIWGRALLEKRSFYRNEPAPAPEELMPAGRFLVTPIVYQERVIGLILVGDKTTDYTQEDQAFLEDTVTHIAPVLAARLQRDAYKRALGDTGAGDTES